MPAFLHAWYQPMHESYLEECARLLGAVDVKATPREPVPDGVRDGFPLVTTTTAFKWRPGLARAR